MNFTLCKNKCNYTKRNKRSRNPTLSVQPFQNRTIPRSAPSRLPPLSKGGGLTARHKLLLCCVLLAICPLFLYCKLFAVKTEGLLYHLSLSTTSMPPLSKVRCCRPKEFGRLPEGLPQLHRPPQSSQPVQKYNNPCALHYHPCLPCQR